MTSLVRKNGGWGLAIFGRHACSCSCSSFSVPLQKTCLQATWNREICSDEAEESASFCCSSPYRWTPPRSSPATNSTCNLAQSENMSQRKYRVEGETSAPKFWDRWFRRKKTGASVKDLKAEINMVRMGGGASKHCPTAWPCDASLASPKQPLSSLRCLSTQHTFASCLRSMHVGCVSLWMQRCASLASLSPSCPPLPSPSQDEHQLSVSELLERYSSDVENGLTEAQAAEVLQRDGPNTLTPPKQMPEIVKFLLQMFGGFSALLWLGAVLCFFSYGVERGTKGPSVSDDNVSSCP